MVEFIMDSVIEARIVSGDWQKLASARGLHGAMPIVESISAKHCQLTSEPVDAGNCQW